MKVYLSLKTRRSFFRLMLGNVYIFFVLCFSRDLAVAGKGLFWPGVVLMAAGFGLRFWAHGHIRKGKYLATGGPYGLTRNPLYLGSLVNAIGLSVAAESYRVLAIGALPLTIAYIVMIRGEHKTLQNRYGAEYADYKKSVNELLPFPTKYFFYPRDHFSLKTAMHNRGWAAALYFAITFLILDLTVLVVWPSILFNETFFHLIANYFVNYIPNHF